MRAFSGLARELGLEPGQLALAWILRRPGITSVITGATVSSRAITDILAGRTAELAPLLAQYANQLAEQ